MASEEQDQQQSKRIKGTKKYKPNQSKDADKQNDNSKAEPNDDKSQRKAAKEAKKEEKKKRKGRVRYLPVWLRFLLVIVLSAAALVLGLMVGYGIVGEGDDPSGALDPDMWQRMYDYIRGK
ncbi:hypothetical protein ABID56_002368 [Alkalibacillus flavidus]|uniref:DNA-directed RNA polymerase subunit beta n=1 Tax=Alkalibacillus flavidus TaxID=546021 RepID=A0ABV2KYN5_9BACI